MSIDLRKFVDINIIYHDVAKVTSTRDTVVYWNTIDNTVGDGKIYDNYADVEYAVENGEIYGGNISDNVKRFAKAFFDNGGGKILFPVNSIYQATTDNKKAAVLAKDEYVVHYFNSEAGSTPIVEALAEDEDVYGIKEKILLADTLCGMHGPQIGKNLAIKAVKAIGYEGDAGSIAAYLSAIDFYKDNSVKDYCYTEEKFDEQDLPSVDDEDLQTILDDNLNVDIKLAGKIMNIGGNLADGHDIVNKYSLIVLQQLLTDRIFSLLSTKLKGSAGVSEIQAVVADEMTKFTKNGFLSTDKVWNDNALTVVYGGVTYTIIEKDEPLPLGYKFVVLPIQALTAEDKAARKAPPMYLIVADSYGIRKVTINGEVI